MQTNGSPDEQKSSTPMSSLKDDVDVQIFPDGYRNELFENNLLYFQSAKPEIYEAVKDHHCTEYKMCLNPDGSPNILHVNSGVLVYEQKPKADILQEIRNNIENINLGLIIQEEHVVFESIRGGESSSSTIDREYQKGEGFMDTTVTNKDPLMVHLHEAIFNEGSYQQLNLMGHLESGERDFNILDTIMNDYLPYIRVYGLGLGYHLIELINNKKISIMDLYEPNLDLFYSSLYTVPWELVFRYFELKNKALYLYIANPYEHVIDSINRRMLGHFRFLVTTVARYNNFSGSAEINSFIEKEPAGDKQILLQNNGGWYEDQRAGLYFSLRNIKQNHPVFNGTKVNQFFRVFIVGNGPSLNESIGFIKENQKNAVIFSCGTALTALLNSGIVPDFQVLQERDWHGIQFETYHDKSLLNNITLLKLNVVSTVVDSFYKKVLLIQKANDPGSFLLNKNYPNLPNVNPTVTNAAVTIAAKLAADEIYLFGCDYGTPKGASRMHASNSLYTEASDSLIKEQEIKGNFDEIIETSNILAHSQFSTEQRILSHPSIRWFNVGNGALIQGTEACQVTELPELVNEIDKKKVLFRINECFDSNYDADGIKDSFVHNAEKMMVEYLESIMEFSKAKPETQEDILAILQVMNKVVDFNDSEISGFIPTLINGSIQEFLRNVYTQSMVFNDDARAIKFFNKAFTILNEYNGKIVLDIKKFTELVCLDEEVNIKDYY
jgi:hypothetical protein